MKILKDMFGPARADVSIIPVLQGDMVTMLNESELPDALPILALRNTVLFPGTVIPVTVGREKSMKLIKDAERDAKLIGTVPQKDAFVEDPVKEDLYDYGTVAKIVKTIEMPDGSITAILQGYNRFRVEAIVEYAPYLLGRVEYLREIPVDKADPDIKAIAENIKDAAARILKMSVNLPKEAIMAINGIDNFEFLINFASATIDIEEYAEKLQLLSISDLKTRSLKLLELLNKQFELLKIKEDINQKVKSEIDQQQREYYLNNQLRTIQEELGMDEAEEFRSLRQKAEKKNWSKETAEIFEKEMQKLERSNPNSPDYNVQLNYLTFMLDLPWNDVTKDNLDIKHAQKVLDKDHYGLEQVKERIIEYLAVMKLRQDMKSPILCLYGPPGVGKTSLGKSVARALGRKYVRISLGGLHDEAEIRGHRKTYIGALPGRIINGIARCGSSNPVMVLDEIDKISSDFKGDPSSALLEVLDPEQNTTFHDNYLDVDYDLSKVLFITTANTVSTIHPALRDRMEMINVSGYLAEEKASIATGYLIPKELKAHGLTSKDLKISKPALMAIINDYTRESGVRNLEKQIAKIARVTAKKIALGQDRPVRIEKTHLKEYLGLPVAFHDKQEGNEAPGVVTGLAWTEVGGEILFVECSVSEATGGAHGVLTMTGNLGDVMKESATIAYQYLKAHPALAKMTAEEFAKKDLHIHVPEGATPKDGPSAGITMVSAMASALRGEKVRSHIAMTGEMTLRGRVLPVGGIKEKILAAKRAGVTTIVLSKENRRDIEDIKEVYTTGLSFVYVDAIDEVIKYIFED
ncbi:MAG: endopeptidase La [Bacteroidetes bacterium]|uniref:Lon protease n=1 Tax=Candidatus Merdivivens pullicola TaxID=2840872 RepID=A0A9D9IH31_9BACT|nr:endopeptidase La [Candidatus Merdivivens pullicola]